jgi:hypothetical protein
LERVVTDQGIQTFNPRTGQMGPVIAQPQQGGGSDADAAMLLQGGTADKVPIKARSAAVAAARESGGVDGTGFVPMTGQQQQKYSDFMDLRAKGLRLRELLDDKDVADKLGPFVGSAVDATKEWPLFGQSTKVKEAFDLFTDLSDTELRKRSGAAISPNEYERVTGFTVTPSKQKDSNATNLDRMLDVIDSSLSRMGAERLPPRNRPAGAAGAPPPPPPPAGGSRPVTVQAGGRTFTFPNEAAAAAFRQAAGWQ